MPVKSSKRTPAQSASAPKGRGRKDEPIEDNQSSKGEDTGRMTRSRAVREGIDLDQLPALPQTQKRVKRVDAAVEVKRDNTNIATSRCRAQLRRINEKPKTGSVAPAVIKNGLGTRRSAENSAENAGSLPPCTVTISAANLQSAAFRPMLVVKKMQFKVNSAPTEHPRVKTRSVTRATEANRVSK